MIWFSKEKYRTVADEVELVYYSVAVFRLYCLARLDSTTYLTHRLLSTDITDLVGSIPPDARVSDLFDWIERYMSSNNKPTSESFQFERIRVHRSNHGIRWLVNLDDRRIQSMAARIHHWVVKLVTYRKSLDYHTLVNIEKLEGASSYRFLNNALVGVLVKHHRVVEISTEENSLIEYWKPSPELSDPTGPRGPVGRQGIPPEQTDSFGNTDKQTIPFEHLVTKEKQRLNQLFP